MKWIQIKLAMLAFTLVGCSQEAVPAGRSQPLNSGMAYELTVAEKYDLVVEANGGDSNAALKLGNAWLFSGQSEYLGRYWLYRSAIGGNADAQYNLAMLEREQSKNESAQRSAIFWLRKAAANGNELAARVLSRGPEVMK